MTGQESTRSAILAANSSSAGAKQLSVYICVTLIICLPRLYSRSDVHLALIYYLGK